MDRCASGPLVCPDELSERQHGGGYPVPPLPQLSRREMSEEAPPSSDPLNILTHGGDPW